jgi:uncharacterized protein DUF1302
MRWRAVARLDPGAVAIALAATLGLTAPLMLTRSAPAAAQAARTATDDQAPETTTADWLKDLRIRGRVAEAFAYRLHDPGDVSKIMTLGWLEGKYTLSDAADLRVATRGWYDAVFEATDRYPANVERDQKTELSLREAILTLRATDVEVRLGRQQIVWGEAISTFITDVVNPKDFREFVLPDFTELRIPIWALDVVYRLAHGITLEGVWTPDTMPNRLPKQGAEFQFARVAYRFRNPVVRLPDDADEFSVARSEGGARLSVLREGWDVALLYYDQADKTPVFFQRRVPQPPAPDVIGLEPRHPRVHVVGATLGKSLDEVVIRSEVAATIGKRYDTTDPQDRDGVVRRDTIDYLVGVDYTFFGALDTSLQVSQKILAGSATNVARAGVDGLVSTAVALRLATGFLDDTLNPSVLVVVGANRGDLRVSPRLDWLATGSLTVSIGADVFEGPKRTLYGQFDRNDRVTFTTTWRF